MPWLRLDDTFAQHPKIIGLTDPAFRLHIAGMTYAARHLTDGIIPAAALTSLYPNRALRTVNELIVADLWHHPGHADCPTCQPTPTNSYTIHDYLLYNPTAAEAKAAAEARSAKAQRAAQARWNNNAPSKPRASRKHMLPDAPYPSPNTPPNPPHSLADRILDYVAQTQTAKSNTTNPDRYRKRIRKDLEQQRPQAERLATEYPTAPLDCLAAGLLGEPSGGLWTYRKAEEQ